MLMLKYCSYGFGFPLMLTFLIWILHAFDALPEEYKREVGSCFFGGTPELEIVYRILPLAIMLSVNVIFYATTALTIFKVQRQTACLKNARSNSRHAQNKKRFKT